MKYDPVAIARQFAFVRETTGADGLPNNRGLRVEAIQHWSSGQAGDSWCAEFATMVLDIAFQGASPIQRLQACQDIYELAIEQHWLVDVPVPGDLFLYVDANDRAHHVGIVTGYAPLTGIAGNTSEDGRSSDGDGVHEHAIAVAKFVHYPREMAHV